METQCKILYLEEWNKHSNIFLWKKDSCFLKKTINNKKNIDGFLKKHFIGKDIIIYKENSQWKLYFDKKPIVLEDINSVFVNYFPCSYLMSFKIKNKKYIFFDFDFLNYFAKFYDNTYDSFDKEIIFGEWLDVMSHRLNGEPL